MKHHHFPTDDAEGARDLRLALAWIAAALIGGAAANILVMIVRLHQ
jgi:hypothetical protein